MEIGNALDGLVQATEQRDVCMTAIIEGVSLIIERRGNKLKIIVEDAESGDVLATNVVSASTNESEMKYIIDDLGSGTANTGTKYLSFAIYESDECTDKPFYKECTLTIPTNGTVDFTASEWSTSKNDSYMVYDDKLQCFNDYRSVSRNVDVHSYERLWEDISKKDWVVPHNKEYLLFDVLQDIPSIERKVLILNYESKSVYDIAKELSMTVTRVESLKSRGIERVQTRLKFMLTSETYRDNAEYYGWDNLRLMELDDKYKNVLLRKGYKSVRCLMCMSEEEILRIEGIDETGLLKIKEALGNRGLYLNDSLIPTSILSVYYRIADSIGDCTIPIDKSLDWYREQIFERGPVAWTSLKLVYGIKLSTVDAEELKYRPEDDLRKLYAEVIEAIHNSWGCLA